MAADQEAAPGALSSSLWPLESGGALRMAHSCVVCVFALLVLHVVRRLVIDRTIKLPGLAPSRWNPFGAEQLLWSTVRKVGHSGEGLYRFLGDVCARYADADMIRLWAFSTLILVARGARAAEYVMTSKEFVDKSFFYDQLKPWLGTGLLTSGGAKWRSRRKLLTPAFHFEILNTFMGVFNAHSRALADRLLKRKTNVPVNIVHDVTNSTLSIICETAMGVRIDAHDNADSEYVRAIYEVGDAFVKRSSNPLLWNDFVFRFTSLSRRLTRSLKVLHDFAMKVIVERREEMKTKLNSIKSSAANVGTEDSLLECTSKRRPFLDLLLERNVVYGDLSLEDVLEEVDTFMFEGHDTTAMGISWALYLLSENKDCQKKVLDELYEIFGDDDRRDATIEDLKQMKYLECCIKEAQRLYPSVPLIARTVHTDTNYKNSIIPAGTNIMIPIFVLHRDPDVFPEPERFDPDRFLPENCLDRHPFAYVPFSAGPRNCIGQKFAMMEEKVVISWVLRRVSLKSAIPRSSLRVTAELVTRSRDGLPVFVEPRAHVGRAAV